MRFAVPIGFVIAALLALSAAHGQQAQPRDAQKDRDHEAWVQNCWKDFQAIKKGMTRAEVEARLGTDGGLSSAGFMRFVHPACSLFKIDVEFDYKRDANDQGRAITGKDDKVIRVSKPYIEPMFMD
jgi:hypothetical protein